MCMIVRDSKVIGPGARVAAVSVILALSAAMAYGISDFVGGLLSRRASAYSVATYAQAAGAFCLTVAALIAGAEHVGGGPVAWGMLSGVGSGIGTIFLYRGLGSARMSVVAPLSAVGAAGIPVIVGFALGERPAALAIAGIVLALPAIWLITRDESGPDQPTARTGVLDGFLAGAGFSVLFIALAQVPEEAGLYPLAAGQLTAFGVVLTSALLLRAALTLPSRVRTPALLIGGLAGAATLLYQLAAHGGLLAVVAVLTSLYPALTVLAAVVVLRERVTLGQTVGLVAAAGTVSLIALS